MTSQVKVAWEKNMFVSVYKITDQNLNENKKCFFPLCKTDAVEYLCSYKLTAVKTLIQACKHCSNRPVVLSMFM